MYGGRKIWINQHQDVKWNWRYKQAEGGQINEKPKLGSYQRILSGNSRDKSPGIYLRHLAVQCSFVFGLRLRKFLSSFHPLLSPPSPFSVFLLQIVFYRNFFCWRSFKHWVLFIGNNVVITRHFFLTFFVLLSVFLCFSFPLCITYCALPFFSLYIT